MKKYHPNYNCPTMSIQPWQFQTRMWWPQTQGTVWQMHNLGLDLQH